ncbi:hypothetical protein N7505_010041 [Penicillium chrysogenum]|uniref:Granaticin polyketide synthase ketoacyl reductase n=1 Tax=Penicillium chrysogenum TaxID=5076 RepID=A0ABQ8W2I2_PENCH|nr:hypothetical protein N7505_010041 [Penicillium chrysogenum]
MPYSLSGRNVLITGGSRGLGALAAEKFASEGSNVAINYMSSKEVADKLASDIASKYGVKAVVIQGDAGVKDDCINAVKTTIEKLGGLDIIISNACWSVNVKSSLHLFKAALPTFNANPEGGVFLITASIAGIMPSGSSLPYAVSKAASIHLMKCLAKTQGAKVRVNAILPGLLLTEWPEVEDCADMFITLAKNASITGQAVQIDSGFVI